MTVGFKSSYLRAVQRKLDLLTIHGIQQHEWDIHELAGYMPTATVERIEFLATRGLIFPGGTDTLIRAYGWFLQQYHRAQHDYKKLRQRTRTPFNHQSFETHRQAILEFAYWKLQ